ncbi:MAG: putative ABC transport system permease protein [Patiriisocius sp.]|jgi:putative ABC transport system permease protein
MFGYYLKLASISIRRNPVLTGLMVLAIALGIGACMTTITVNYVMSSDPIPHKSEQLYYVQVDSWDPNSPYTDDGDPPDQITWTEATNFMKDKKAFRQTAIASSGGVIVPPGQDSKPFMATLRITYADFFPMFDLPFLYGSGWPASADDNHEFVVVLSRKTNEEVFGGEDSVGRALNIEGREFRVVGVLDEYFPVPLFYDLSTGAFDTPEDVYLPFVLKEDLELSANGNVNCWKSPEGEGFTAFLQSECVNYQMWVELPSQSEKREYEDYLYNYVTEQKSLGRFERPLDNRLSNVMEWMEDQEVVEDDAQILLWLSFMFLAVCLLNTIGLLLSKFVSKSAEIGLRRAVGASRQDLFTQHLVETGVIGIVGGFLGLGLALLGLEGVKMLYADLPDKLVQLDTTMVIVALLLALVSSIAAGLYPTWKACNIAPASQLKSQ